MMNLEKSWKKDAMDHAEQCYPEESCGLVAKLDGEENFWKCKNVAFEYKMSAFVIDTDDWIECEDSVDDIIGIVHNHPDGVFEFSLTDKMSCRELDLTFYLVEPATDRMIKIEPCEVKC